MQKYSQAMTTGYSFTLNRDQAVKEPFSEKCHIGYHLLVNTVP